MRRLLSFECQGQCLAASLDEGLGETGLLMVTGGTQVRVGSHRMYEKLARSLAGAGVSSFRFDRRGVGDSEGEDPDFRDSGPDIAAAAAAFRSEAPEVERVVGFGLCDGATAIALHGAAAGLDGLILVNPWLTEAQSGQPAPAAVRRHYRDRLLSVAGWKKLLTGAVDLRKLVGGLRRGADTSQSSLALDAAAALMERRLPTAVILCRDDATAVAARHELKRRELRDTKSGELSLLDVEGGFVAIGHSPATELFRG
ncbi:MAG TPA: hydrolase 1, exosortase A system-associated, partial [Allosphingosinicella sp.]|nr:hydrolase 1, exosortase A system-associated [Allosphingosinicella sp.]